MKIIQTLWTKPGLSGGWPEEKFHCMSWALSVLRLSEYYDDIVLYTDEKGAAFLEDLGLPYREYRQLPSRLEDYESYLWAVAKLNSFREQDEPFIHVDGDVFLWHPLNLKEHSNPIFFQNLEVDMNVDLYTPALKEIIEKNFTNIPNGILETRKWPAEVVSCNTGVFGGDDLNFIHSYANQAIAFVDQNRDKIRNLKNKSSFAFMLEQHLLYLLIRTRRIKYSTQLSGTVTDLAYPGLANFWDLPRIKYLHTLHSYKRSKLVISHLERTLRKLYPQVYLKILANYANTPYTINVRQILSKPIDTMGIEYLKQYQKNFGNSAKGSPAEESYLLTRKLIDQLPNNEEGQASLEILDYLKNTDYSALKNLYTLSDLDVEILSDCFLLEKEKQKLINTDLSYERTIEDIVNFAYAQDSLSERIDSTFLFLNPDVVFTQTKWCWWDENIELEKIKATAPEKFQLILKYDVRCSDVTEILVDKAQLVLVKLLVTKTSLLYSTRQLIDEMAAELNLPPVIIIEQLRPLVYYNVLISIPIEIAQRNHVNFSYPSLDQFNLRPEKFGNLVTRSINATRIMTATNNC